MYICGFREIFDASIPFRPSIWSLCSQICKVDDTCPLDPENDVDGDKLCGNVDTCPNDFTNDVDNDGYHEQAHNVQHARARLVLKYPG